MRSRIVITENDRRSILSMYNLLNEQTTKKILGKVTRSGDYKDLVSNTPAVGVKVNLYKINKSGGFDELVLIDTQETDKSGSFEFIGLESFENLFIRTDENEFYKSKELDVPDSKENVQNIVISISFKEGKKIEKQEQQPLIEPCQEYVSDDKTFYGKAKSSIFNPKDDDNVHDQIVIDAKIDALKQYLLKNYIFSERHSELIEKLKNENSIKYKIVCSERMLNDKNVSIKYITVKIDKTDFDLFTKEIEDIKVEAKINFQKIGFRELIKKSKDENKKAFVILSNSGEIVSDDLLQRLNMSSDNVNKLNSDYICVNYINDESDIDGYVLASNNLDVYTIPSIIILKGTKDPYPITGSFRVISRYTDFSDYFNNFTNYLERVNNLIK